MCVCVCFFVDDGVRSKNFGMRCQSEFHGELCL